MTSLDIQRVDPASPDATACLAAYVEELNRLFPASKTDTFCIY